MTSRFKQATRQKSRLRMAIDGPSGSGKTYTALRFANAFGDNARIAVIDTERGSASKYTGESPDGRPWQFDTLELLSFSPTEYTAAIQEAGQAGYDVLVIDSLSHAWSGKDGALELVDRSKATNSFSAWKDVTPMHTRMVDAILGSSCHVICTMRSKTEYILEANDKGKMVPTKIGMQPIQRAGMEYEFDVYASIDQNHTLTVSKTRCSPLDGIVVVKPSGSFMMPLLEWLSTGSASLPPELSAASLQRLTNDQLTLLVQTTLIRKLQPDRLEAELLKRFQVHQLIDLTSAQADELIRRWGANATPNPEPTANGHIEPASPANPSTPMATTEQLTAIRETLIALRQVGRSLTKEQWESVLSKRNVARPEDLTATQADEILARLKERGTATTPAAATAAA